MPKTAKDESSAAAGLPGGKKLRAITLAKKTYTPKSVVPLEHVADGGGE